MMEQELYSAGFSKEDKKMRARQLAAQMEMHMLTASPSRAAYDALIQRACEYDAEFESERALTYFQYSHAMYKAVLQKDPMSWIREHDAAVFPPPVYAAERIYRLSGEIYGKHDNRTFCALREWADMVNSSEDGWRIFTYLENAWRDLRHREGRFDEAQQFAVLLGRALLKAGEGQLSLKVFEKVYNEEKEKRGLHNALFALHRVGWVHFENGDTGKAKEVFLQEMEYHRQLHHDEHHQGVEQCRRALALMMANEQA